MAVKESINSMEYSPAPYLWTRAQYECAIDAGVFDFDPHAELVGGEIIRTMSPQKSPHATAICALQEEFTSIFSTGYCIRIQLPLALGDDSEPEPDIAVVVGSRRDYKKTHPATAVLVAEVSDSSTSFDRTTKASLYARSGIPEYWILNLPLQVLEVFRYPVSAADEPFGYHYSNILQLDIHQIIAPLAAPHTSIAVADLFD